MHEGHRGRLLSKLNDGNLFEHEILEVLLFNAYPRKNVNPLAHALLTRFINIKQVLEADVEELCTVEGVGINVALYLKCVGKCLSLVNNCDSLNLIRNNSEFVKFIRLRFKDKSVEFFEVYMLDKAGRVMRIGTYTSYDPDKVLITREELLKLISVNKPYGIFVAHNHVNCSSAPSSADDILTKEIQLICSISNVNFYDHCIYASDDDIYSYYMSNRIDEIKYKYSVESIIRYGEKF